MLIPALCALVLCGFGPSSPTLSDDLPGLEGSGGDSTVPRHRKWENPLDRRTFTIGTSDSAGLKRWLDTRKWPHRSLGAGLFEVEVQQDSLDSLATVPGVDRIEAPPRRRHHALDASRTRIRGEPVHLGSGLSGPHRGTKALVGIIDVGFDLKHPAFQDSMGKSRIIRLWDQTGTGGRPPAGFSSGSLYTTPEVIQQLGRSKTQATHGTHVAGLAAGRVVPGSGGTWWGVADDARIALVDCGDGCRGINDGLRYLFRLGDSLKLPVAVNLSWGTLNGPRNGNSSDCMIAKSLVGPGKVVVVSAGNSGGKAAHAQHDFNGDTARYALQVSKGSQTLSNGTTRTIYFNEVEFWGDSNKTYKAWIELLGSNDALLGTSPVFSMGTQSTWQSLNSSFRVGSDTVWYSGNIEKRSGQGGLRLTVSTNRSGTQLRLVVNAPVGRVHGWIWEDGLAFLKLGSDRCKGCVVPDSNHVISDKATCPAVISVAAIDGNGRKASFTSRGPGLGPVPKPDISAPGVSIVSSLNSGYPGGSVSATYNGFPWGPMSGTSMSAPLVTGAVALLLETDPKLTPDNIIQLFKGARTAYSSDTGWARLDVLGLFDALESPSVAATRPAPTFSANAIRTWITADGRRVAVPAGAMPGRFHPGGIAWLQTCEDGVCTSRGLIGP